jgi:hypothetical protein
MAHRAAAAVTRELLENFRVGDGELVGLLDRDRGLPDVLGHPGHRRHGERMIVLVGFASRAAGGQGAQES